MGSHARFELRLPHSKTDTYLILEAGNQPLHLTGEKLHGALVQSCVS